MEFKHAKKHVLVKVFKVLASFRDVFKLFLIFIWYLKLLALEYFCGKSVSWMFVRVLDAPPTLRQTFRGLVSIF